MTIVRKPNIGTAVAMLVIGSAKSSYFDGSETIINGVDLNLRVCVPKLKVANDRWARRQN